MPAPLWEVKARSWVYSNSQTSVCSWRASAGCSTRLFPSPQLQTHRMEMEADYIGLLLLAAAGYDPRVAPRVYEKLGQITGDSMLKDYLSTHPSSKKRAELLSQAEVMGEALAIYQEAIIGHAVLGFI